MRRRNEAAYSKDRGPAARLDSAPSKRSGQTRPHGEWRASDSARK